MEVKLGLDDKMLKMKKKSALEAGGHHDRDKRKSQLRNRRGHHVRAHHCVSFKWKGSQSIVTLLLAPLIWQSNDSLLV